MSCVLSFAEILLPNYIGTCNTANDCKLALSIYSKSHCEKCYESFHMVNDAHIELDSKEIYFLISLGNMQQKDPRK